MRYPLFSVDMTGRSPNVSRQRRVNVIAEVKPAPDKTQLVHYNTPGKVLFADFGTYAARGIHSMGSRIYMVVLNGLYSVDSLGVTTYLGSLTTTSGFVSMADNGTQVAVADGSHLYIYDTSGPTFTTVASALFANPTYVTFLDGYFICCFNNSGRYQISSLYDGTTFGASDYARAESNPDNLTAVIALNGQLMLAGEVSIEFAGNTGAVDFPFARVQGATIEWGLAARYSLARFNDSVMFLAQNRDGQVTVATLNGYSAQSVCTPDMAEAINAYSAVTDASGFSFRIRNRAFYQINFPTQGASWLFDGLSGLWSELQSGLSGGRDIAERAINFGQRTYVTDYSRGRIYTLDMNTYTDNGAPVIRELASRHVFSESWMHVYRVWLDVEGGVGNTLAPGDDPRIMFSVSKDGGHTFGTERMMSVGKTGAYSWRCYVTRLGRSRDWVFRFRISDPVKFTVMGGWMTTEANAQDDYVQPAPKMVA